MWEWLFIYVSYFGDMSLDGIVVKIVNGEEYIVESSTNCDEFELAYS
jgi:hypothetical protein